MRDARSRRRHDCAHRGVTCSRGHDSSMCGYTHTYVHAFLCMYPLVTNHDPGTSAPTVWVRPFALARHRATTATAMATSLSRAYVSVGTNRAPSAVAFAPREGRRDAHGVDDDDDDVIFFAGGDACAVYDVRQARIARTVRGDGARGTTTSALGTTVTAVCALDGGGVVFGDARGWCFFATTRDGGAPTVEASCSHASGPVRDACAVRVGVRVHVVLTCADDGAVRVWRVEDGGRAATASGAVAFDAASGPLCVDIARAPSSSLHGDGDAYKYIMAVGCVDGRTRIYVCDFSALAAASASEGVEATFETCGTLDGHADWVRGVKFSPTRGEGVVFLATASQDKSARVWRIQTVALDAADGGEKESVAAFMRLAAPPKPPSALLAGRRIKTSLESLLIGHEDWVMSVAWHPDSSKMVLMTASMDRSLMLWSPTGVPSTSEEAGSELWMSTASLGEAAAVCLGYYGASFSPKGDMVLANSHGGALHVWRQTVNDEWAPEPANSGHMMEVTCLQWDAAGRWLMSGGQDQTTRVHAPWNGDAPRGWRQVARPQVHGHDIVCLATMREAEAETGTITYVSGADEKILRVFEAPGTFLGTIANSLGDADAAGAAALTTAKALSMEALGAELPALGLSNKALRGTDQEDLPSDVAGLRAQAEQQDGFLIEEYNSRGVEAITPQALATPPLEEVLAQATLWPEVRKLYGHGNEIRAVAAHCRGDLIASASAALTSAAASVWIWSRSQSWKPLGQLVGATLTVTALEFTPESAERDCLLAASRDRHVCLFAPASASSARGEFSSESWRLVTRFKAHDREIFAASWAPCGTLFATAGRDKKIKIWRWTGDTCALEIEFPKFDAAPTAVAFAPVDLGLTLAIGFDDGAINVFTCGQHTTSAWTLAARTAPNERHGAAIRDVKWQPRAPYALASCANDHAVHVYDYTA